MVDYDRRILRRTEYISSTFYPKNCCQSKSIVALFNPTFSFVCVHHWLASSAMLLFVKKWWKFFFSFCLNILFLFTFFIVSY